MTFVQPLILGLFCWASEFSVVAPGGLLFLILVRKDT